MKRRVIMFLFLGAIVLSVILVPILLLVIDFDINLLFELQFEQFLERANFIILKMSLIEYATLYLAILGILISTIMTYFIYRIERDHEQNINKEEIKRVKRILKVLLKTGIQRAHESVKDDQWTKFDFINVTENHISLIASIGHLISDEEFIYINKIMGILKKIYENESNSHLWEAREAVNKLMGLITIPIYLPYVYHMKRLESVNDTLNKEVIGILKFLSEKNEPLEFLLGEKLDKYGNKVLEISNTNHFKVYDENETLICDGLFDEQKIINGQAQILTKDGHIEFEGDFKDGRKNGYGIEYLFNEKPGRKGEWQEDKLVDGIIYDVILNELDELFMDSNTQVSLHSDLYKLAEYYDELKVGNVKVRGKEEIVIKDSIRTAIEFLSDNE